MADLTVCADDGLLYLACKNLLGPLVQLLAATVAISGVFWTVRNTRKNQLIKQAHDTYEAYTKDALEYPKLATGYVQIPPSYDAADDEFFRYEWLVARLLNAGEQILELVPQDTAWRDAISGQIKQHKKYLASDYFGNVEFRMYSKQIRTLICNAVGSEECKKLRTEPRKDNG